MSFSYFAAWAQAPTTAPTVTGTVNTNGYQVAYRIRTNSGFTDSSPFTGSFYQLPFTAQCSPYIDNPRGLAYEVIGRGPGGLIVTLGASANPTVNCTVTGSSTTLEGAFASPSSFADLGVFGAGTNPTYTFYVKHTGSSLSYLVAQTLRATGDGASELEGNLLISIDGTLHGETGNGVLDLSTTLSKYLGSEYTDGNLFPIPTLNNDVHKVTLTLSNFTPKGVFRDYQNDFRFGFAEGARTFAYAKTGYLPNPLFVQQGGVLWPPVTGGVWSQKLVYAYGRLYNFPTQVPPTFPTSGGGTDVIWVDAVNGTIFTTSLTATPGANVAMELARFTGGAWVPKVNYLPNHSVHGPLATNCLMGDVLYWTTSQALTTTVTGARAGIALVDGTAGQQMAAATSGVVFVRTTAASIANVGAAISPNYGPVRLYTVNVTY